MELIIISGIAKVGKTTLAKLLAREAFELGFRPVLLSFAGPLKKEAEARGFTKEGNPAEHREFCQVHGAMKRDIDPDYWVKEFEKKLIVLYDEEEADLKKNKKYWQRCVIVDDCRYENEVSLGIKHNSTNIYISSGNRTLSDMNADWRQHHSEDMANAIESGDDDLLDAFEYTFLNDGDIEALEVKTKVMAPVWCGIRSTPPHVDKGSLRASLNELIDLFLLDFEDESDDDSTE